MNFDITITNNNELTNKEDKVMTNQEKARQYFAENTKPVYSLCPIVKQRWKTADGDMYWDSKTMMRTYFSGDRWTPTVKGFYEGSYIRYVADLGAIEIAEVKADGGRGKNGVPMEWCYPYSDTRCLIFKEDPAGYFANGRVKQDCKFYSNAVVSLMMLISRNGMERNVDAQKGECEKAGIVFDSDYHYYGVYNLKEYYKKNWMPRSVSKKACTINDVVLEDVDLSSVRALNKTDVLVIQPSQDYMILRMFHRYYSDDDYDESFRIYIDKKGKPTVCQKRYGSGKWDVSTASIHRDTYNHYSTAVIGEENIDNWEPLKYLKSVIDFTNRNVCEILVQTLRHPIIEQLNKSGYCKIAKALMKENQIAANLKYFFRQEKETKQPLYKLLGVNKWLLKAIEDMPECHNGYYSYDGRMQVLRMIKFFYDRFDISDIDKATIEMLIAEFSQIDMGMLRELCGYSRYGYRGDEPWPTVTEETRNSVFKLMRINRKDTEHNILRYYLDTKRMYDQIDNKPDIDLHRFNDFHGLEIIHDALVEIKTQEDAARQARWNEAQRIKLENQRKGFEKLQKERVERFNAESDKYLIRVPNELEEITKEGLALHHCVGGYLGTHASGGTNIIFLRKKEDPDTPFYTIEVDVMGRVVQIHGSHNKWLGNDPEAIPFVWKWINDRHLDCSKKILLNLGAGYGASVESLDESYLTKEVI